MSYTNRLKLAYHTRHLKIRAAVWLSMVHTLPYLSQIELGVGRCTETAPRKWDGGGRGPRLSAFMVEEFKMFKISLVPFGVQKDQGAQLRKIIYPPLISETKNLS